MLSSQCRQAYLLLKHPATQAKDAAGRHVRTVHTQPPQTEPEKAEAALCLCSASESSDGELCAAGISRDSGTESSGTARPHGRAFVCIQMKPLHSHSLLMLLGRFCSNNSFIA